MKNLYPLTLLFVFLTHKNIILLNEEFLIFLSFITFVIIIINKIGPSIDKNFSKETKEIKVTLQKSIKEVSTSLNKFIKIKKTFTDIFLIYKSFTNYIYRISSVSDLIIQNNSKILKNKNFREQLAFAKKVEDQTLKLFAVILMEKIQTIFAIRKFHENKFNFKYFNTLKKIQIRESLNKICP